MQWSDLRQCWCAGATGQKSLIDVVTWCSEQFGPQQIDRKQDGEWSWCDGIYYGLTRNFADRDYPDNRTYFSFKHGQDAIFFTLKWGNRL